MPNSTPHRASISRRRATVIANHVIPSAALLKGCRQSACIGEDGNRVASEGDGPRTYTRKPLRIAFPDPSAIHDRYGGSGAAVVLEGELVRPTASAQQKGGTVLVFMHPGGVLSSLPIIGALAKAGLHVCAMASRYGNNDTTLIAEKVCVDLGAVVKHLKQKLGYDKVVLCGWSGGGGLASLYQSIVETQKEEPLRTPAGDIVGVESLPPADGLALLAAHSGRARVLSEWIDPAVTDEIDPGKNRDASVDIYGKHAPTHPFSNEFVARYRSAQRARVRRITAWAKDRLDILEKEVAESKEDWRRRRRDDTFTVHCTQADIARLDVSIDPSDRPAQTVDGLADENHSPVGLARFTTLRSWLSQWSIDDSRMDATQALQNISVPVFILTNSADGLVLPKHGHDMYSAVQHSRKHLCTIQGATHYFFGQPTELRKAVFELKAWLHHEDLVRSVDNEEEPLPQLRVDDLRALTPARLPSKLELRGINHLALVSSDMNRTTRFVCEKLGMPLVKTLELGSGGGQHFFFDAGNGCSLAYFWWPDAKPAAPGIAAPVDNSQIASEADTHTAIGSMNHVAWAVPQGRLKEYRRILKSRGIECSPILHHADEPGGYVIKPGPSTTFSSFYFRGPDGEYFEFTEQYRTFEIDDVAHEPRTRADLATS
eukprot:TRINITY_DN23155_c0_g1_i1.p1 TRINITY_DN23155_c0_g1~~TRINITY_DN23155_c0_g1_i1.p1  ORF type:complete len:657 (+),score=77.28 TRINITY_DN23155_c0_g1_i1:56-2026(+)